MSAKAIRRLWFFAAIVVLPVVAVSMELTPAHSFVLAVACAVSNLLGWEERHAEAREQLLADDGEVTP